MLQHRRSGKKGSCQDLQPVMLSGCMRACATKIPGCTDTPCSIHGRSGAFRDGYNLNHLNGLLNSTAWVWRGAASAQTFLARAIQATHAAGQQASTSPAQRASSGTRPGGRKAILATLRPAGVTEQRVQQPKAWTAARRKPPIALLRRRRRPAPTAPCIPHAPKTLRNRASPIFKVHTRTP